MPPDLATESDCEILKQSLCDTAKLDVSVVSAHLSFDKSSVFFSFPVEILLASSRTYGRHCLHPEVVGIGSKSVESLLEADFDLEAISIGADDFEGLKRS